MNDSVNRKDTHFFIEDVFNKFLANNKTSHNYLEEGIGCCSRGWYRSYYWFRKCTCLRVNNLMEMSKLTGCLNLVKFAYLSIR